MEDLKSYKKVFSGLGFCYLIGTAAVYVLQLAASYLLKSLKPEWLENINFSLILSSLIVYGVAMPLIVLLAKRLPVRKPERHAMKWWQFLLAAIMCYAMMICSNLIGTLLTTVIGAVKGSEVQNQLLDVVTSSNVLVNFLTMVVAAPIVEEYVFRKVLVDRTLRYGQGVAIVTSGLMFGLFHGNLNQLTYAWVLGCFFAFLYIKTGNLKITIGIHAIINFFGSIVAPGILKLIKFDSLANMDASDPEAVLGMFTENPVGWALYMVYALIVFGVVIAGIILVIVSICCKRFKLEASEVSIPKGKRFSTVVLNPGMLVFGVVWVVLIILQLFA